MAYDEGLTQRIEDVLGDRPDLVAKKMFGGIGFLLRGNMACGVNKDHLVVRVGPDRYEAALAQPHVKEFDITGRSMKGWVIVEPPGYESDEDLQDWVQQGFDFALSLPPK